MNFTNSPALRAASRAVATAVIAYLVLVFASGQEAFELSSFVWGLGAALAYAVQGLLLPTEPFVGLTKQVKVPASLARPTVAEDEVRVDL